MLFIVDTDRESDLDNHRIKLLDKTDKALIGGGTAPQKRKS